MRGQSLSARVFGQGQHIIMLVGGIHGGYEANTIRLVDELIAYFETTPGAVLPGITLVLIPALNPDGAALGSALSARFNANGVDLNRNWDCGWQPEAFFRTLPVNPGPQPFSEPETVALAALIHDLRPAAVLFYHSAADAIYAGDCPGGGVSAAMSAVYGAAAGYSFGESFGSYSVTGTASTWVDGLGIPSADVELATHENTDFDRNLRGVMALQCWLLGEAVAAIPVCE